MSEQPLNESLQVSSRRANLRAWATFRRACGNELVMDAVLMQSLGLSELLPNVIPRPIHVKRMLTRLKPIWPVLFTTAAASWTWILFPLLLVAQVSRTIRDWHRCPRRTKPLQNDVGIGLTTRVCEVVRCVPTERRPRQWISVPWMPARIPDGGDEAVPLLSVARWRDFFQAAWMAYRAVRIIRRKGLGHCPRGHCRTAILQTYVAWEWFLTWRLLPRHLTPETGVWFANHYDRWAVLLDRLPAGGPRHLIQHGFAQFGLPLAYRLRHTAEVLFFDAATQQVLRDVALAANCRPQWTPLRAQLQLTPWPQSARKTGVILVIGQPVEPHLERELLTALSKAFPNANLLYKAHPLYGRSGAAHVPSPPVEILLTRDTYPAADVVLSGNSWLGVEYESTGTPVVWYKTQPLAIVIERTSGHLVRAMQDDSTAA